MRAGKLRHLVVIRRLGQAMQDPQTGDIASDWVNISTVWASVEPLSGREFIAAQSTQSEVSARIVMRKTEVTAQDKLYFRGDTYNIHTVLPDLKSGNEYLTLMVSKEI